MPSQFLSVQALGVVLLGGTAHKRLAVRGMVVEGSALIVQFFHLVAVSHGAARNHHRDDGMIQCLLALRRRRVRLAGARGRGDGDHG